MSTPSAGQKRFQESLGSQEAYSIPLLDREEEQNKQKKDHRIKATVGVQSDKSLKGEFNVKRIVKQDDNLQIGVKCNQYNEMHYWMTHTMPLFKWNTSLSYEIDTKSLKYLSRERSLVLRASPSDSPWTLKAESTFRKNVVDQYASRKYIINDSLASVKTSLGVEHMKMDTNMFQNFDAEIALNTPRFFKINYQRAQMFNLVKNKINFSYYL